MRQTRSARAIAAIAAVLFVATSLPARAQDSKPCVDGRKTAEEALVDLGQQAFVNALTLHSHVANIGDVRSLVIHPASTTHAQLTPEEQLSTGVTPGLVRLAVGLEGIDDIIADLEQGFAAAAVHGAKADPQAVAAF